jgi:HSP20 family protein
MLARWDLFRDLRNVEDEFDRLAGRAYSRDTWHRNERSFGTFARSLRLPKTADTEKIEASFDKGVLTVSVPKTEQAKPRTIEVQAK